MIHFGRPFSWDTMVSVATPVIMGIIMALMIEYLVLELDGIGIINVQEAPR